MQGLKDFHHYWSDSVPRSSSQCRVWTLIRYIEVDFTFSLSDYVRYNEELIMSRFCSIHFTVTLRFVISRTVSRLPCFSVRFPETMSWWQGAPQPEPEGWLGRKLHKIIYLLKWISFNSGTASWSFKPFSIINLTTQLVRMLNFLALSAELVRF